MTTSLTSPTGNKRSYLKAPGTYPDREKSDGRKSSIQQSLASFLGVGSKQQQQQQQQQEQDTQSQLSQQQQQFEPAGTPSRKLPSRLKPVRSHSHGSIADLQKEWLRSEHEERRRLRVERQGKGGSRKNEEWGTSSSNLTKSATATTAATPTSRRTPFRAQSSGAGGALAAMQMSLFHTPRQKKRTATVSASASLDDPVISGIIGSYVSPGVHGMKARAKLQHSYSSGAASTGSGNSINNMGRTERKRFGANFFSGTSTPSTSNSNNHGASDNNTVLTATTSASTTVNAGFNAPVTPSGRSAAVSPKRSNSRGDRKLGRNRGGVDDLKEKLAYVDQYVDRLQQEQLARQNQMAGSKSGGSNNATENSSLTSSLANSTTNSPAGSLRSANASLRSAPGRSRSFDHAGASLLWSPSERSANSSRRRSRRKERSADELVSSVPFMETTGALGESVSTATSVMDNLAPDEKAAYEEASYRFPAGGSLPVEDMVVPVVDHSSTVDAVRSPTSHSRRAQGRRPSLSDLEALTGDDFQSLDLMAGLDDLEDPYANATTHSRSSGSDEMLKTTSQRRRLRRTYSREGSIDGDKIVSATPAADEFLDDSSSRRRGSRSTDPANTSPGGGSLRSVAKSTSSNRSKKKRSGRRPKTAADKSPSLSRSERRRNRAAAAAAAMEPAAPLTESGTPVVEPSSNEWYELELALNGSNSSILVPLKAEDQSPTPPVRRVNNQYGSDVTSLVSADDATYTDYSYDGSHCNMMMMGEPTLPSTHTATAIANKSIPRGPELSPVAPRRRPSLDPADTAAGWGDLDIAELLPDCDSSAAGGSSTHMSNSNNDGSSRGVEIIVDHGREGGRRRNSGGRKPRRHVPNDDATSGSIINVADEDSEMESDSENNGMASGISKYLHTNNRPPQPHPRTDNNSLGSRNSAEDGLDSSDSSKRSQSSSRRRRHSTSKSPKSLSAAGATVGPLSPYRIVQTMDSDIDSDNSFRSNSKNRDKIPTQPQVWNPSPASRKQKVKVSNSDHNRDKSQEEDELMNSTSMILGTGGTDGVEEAPGLAAAKGGGGGEVPWTYSGDEDDAEYEMAVGESLDKQLRDKKKPLKRVGPRVRQNSAGSSSTSSNGKEKKKSGGGGGGKGGSQAKSSAKSPRLFEAVGAPVVHVYDSDDNIEEAGDKVSELRRAKRPGSERRRSIDVIGRDDSFQNLELNFVDATTSRKYSSSSSKKSSSGRNRGGGSKDRYVQRAKSADGLEEMRSKIRKNKLRKKKLAAKEAAAAAASTAAATAAEVEAFAAANLPFY